MRHPCAGSKWNDGSIILNYSYQTSVTPSSGCTVALPVRIIYFNALLTADKKVKLEWDIANPEEAISFTIEKLNSFNNWTDLSQLMRKQIFTIMRSLINAPTAGENIYRLQINGKDNNVTYSVQKRVVLKFNDRFSVYPNPAKIKLPSVVN